jgi:DNA-binding SARP family transcriptional activator
MERSVDAPRVQVNVLGPVELVVNGDRFVQLGGRGQRTLLAALALAHGHVVTVDQLTDTLWATSPPASARGKIQAHVSTLRKAVAQQTEGHATPLLTRSSGYVLCGEGAQTDLTVFNTLTSGSKQRVECGDYAGASRLLARALALWRGSVCADVTAPSIRTFATAYEERRLLTVEAKAEADLAIGCPESVVVDLPPWLAARPLRERLRALLMVGLYRIGCRTEALHVYHEGRRAMVDELGLEPSAQLRSLHQRMLSGDRLPSPPRPVLSLLSVPADGAVG